MPFVFADLDQPSETCTVFAYQSTAGESWKEKRTKPIGNTFLNLVCHGSSKRSKSWSNPCSQHLAGDIHHDIEWCICLNSTIFDEEADDHDQTFPARSEALQAKQVLSEQKVIEHHHGLDRGSEQGMLEPSVGTSYRWPQLDNLLRIGGAAPAPCTIKDPTAPDHLSRDIAALELQNLLPCPEAGKLITSRSQPFERKNPSTPQLKVQASRYGLKQNGNLGNVIQLSNPLHQSSPTRKASATSCKQNDSPSPAGFELACAQPRRRAAAVLPPVPKGPLMHVNSHNFLQHQHVRACSETLSTITTDEVPDGRHEGLFAATCLSQRLRQPRVNEPIFSGVQRGFEGATPSLSQAEDMTLDWCHAQDVPSMQEQLGYERCMSWADTYESSCDEGADELCTQDAVIETSHVEMEENPDIPEGCTLMIRQIPDCISTAQLVNAIVDLGLGKNIQCVYMPRDFSYGKLKSNGYAFVNFDTIAAAEVLEDAGHRSFLLAASSESFSKHKTSSKPLNIARAKVQGLRENLELWSKSKTSRIRNKRLRPLLFNKAQELLLR